MTSQHSVIDRTAAVLAAFHGDEVNEKYQLMARHLHDSGLLTVELPVPEVSANGNSRWSGDGMPFVAVVDGAVCQLFPNGVEVISDPSHTYRWGTSLIAASLEAG